jgi:His-Xaa-Ser system protein HxsD
VPAEQTSGTHDALRWATDELGVYACVSVDPAVYTKVAILKTAYWFTDKFYVYLSNGADGRILVELRSKVTGTKEELLSACREFCNSVLDHSVRQHVIRETSGVRDSLVRKAFFEARSPEAAVKANGNEAFVPREGQGYRDDPLGLGQPPQ